MEMEIIVKKSGLIFWIFVVVVAFIAVYTVYNKCKPVTQVQQITQQSTKNAETTLAPQTENGSSTDKTAEKPKAYDFNLEDTKGNKVKLSDYKGKIVILNFWATWCPYCVKEMPELESAGKKLQEGKDAVLLTIDVQENPDVVNKYVADKKLELPVLLDTEGLAASEYAVNGFPTTFFINRDGTVYGNVVGATDENTILSTIEKMK
jgi:thiol-disulfide isomerase/thioredoxin